DGDEKSRIRHGNWLDSEVAPWTRLTPWIDKRSQCDEEDLRAGRCDVACLVRGLLGRARPGAAGGGWPEGRGEARRGRPEDQAGNREGGGRGPRGIPEDPGVGAGHGGHGAGLRPPALGQGAPLELA